MEGPRCILAIDPGRQKHGIAVVAPNGACRERAVVASEELIDRVGDTAARYGPVRLLLGGGTGHRAVLARLVEAGFAPEVVPERNSTRRARERYFREHPPTGWRRLLPLGLLVPPRPVDDFAALLLAEDALGPPSYGEISPEK
jgi:hypothetical protein